ncbi:MAG TPA: SMP-30/gluconolactonase/LRE family protein [Bryobacteraceae bacterium]|jgi:DNA-binding beta-propeller fold protein YncE|nr:SMP-30/gluconolactonase/LRE family protein [Bryobacteraceae bacterium]
MIQLSTTTKLMCAGIALSLGWMVLEACECDESTKEQSYPEFWVACVNNKPALMSYNNNDATIVTTDSAGNFNPSEYDCTHAGSPQYKGSQSSSPFKVSSPAGPGGFFRPRVTGTFDTYLPEPVRDLPFTPGIPPATTVACQSNFPDVFRTNHPEDSVTRISTCPFSIKATIPVFTRPLQVVVTPDGSTAIVTSFGPLDGSGGAVTLINVSTNKVTSTIMMPLGVTPNGLAISPDGTTAYIGNFTNPGQSILVMDIASQMITATIQNVVQYPSGLTLTPDGSELWVASPLGGEVDVIDTLSQTEIYRLTTIQDATDIAFNSTGTMAYITSAATTPGQVIAVNTATFQVMNTYTVGNTPSDISMSYGDRFLVVNNDSDVIISVIDLVQNAVKSVTVGSNASGIAFLQ